MSNVGTEIETLRRQLAEKDAQIDIWQRRAWGEKSEHLASQAREAKLREALHTCRTSETSMYQSHDQRRVAAATALPQDDTALRDMIAKAGEVMRERCATKAEWCEPLVVGKLFALPNVTLEDLK